MQEDYNVRKDCNKSSQANPTEVYFWCAIWLIYLLACHFTKHENTLNICSVYLFHTVTIVSIYLEYPLILLLKYVRFAYTHTHIYIHIYTMSRAFCFSFELLSKNYLWFSFNIHSLYHSMGHGRHWICLWTTIYHNTPVKYHSMYL